MPRLALVAFISLCVSGWTFAQESKRYALLVGVNEYQHNKLESLKYAVNDATELGALLEKAGYSVTALTDDAGKKDARLAPTKANIEEKLKAVMGSARKGDLVLVCLAGHGLQFEGDRDAYFCPADARPFKEKSGTLVSIKKVYDELDGSFAGTKVLLVDASRDNHAARQGIDAGAPRPPRGVATIFSCKAGQRAFEVEKYKHGIFFHHVITGLQGEAADRKGRVTFTTLANHVCQEVSNDVSQLIGNGAAQTPVLDASYTNEPVFVARPAVIIPPNGAENEQVAADLRAYGRAAGINKWEVFLREEAPKRLAEWRKAAEAGVPAGQYLLATCLSTGIGVEKDDKVAFLWYKKAAEAGHARAIHSLGLMYANGRGVEKDDKEAFKWFLRAAEAGDASGMNNLGLRYATGRGVEKDDKEAFKWFLRAADAGDFQGMTNLGNMYLNSRGVEKDDKEAVKWFMKSATAGDAQGMVNLGVMYEIGRGVEKDLKEAARWYEKAAEAGNADAKKNLERLGEK